MHSIKTDLSIQGSTTVQQNIQINGSAVITNKLSATGDVDFINATFTKIDVGQSISASTLAISGNINVDGDLIGSVTSEATFNKLSTEEINTTVVSTTDLTSTGIISSDHIINSNKINTKDLVSTASVTSETINTTDLISTGIITSDTMINSNLINTKDLSSSGSVSAPVITTIDLTSTGNITSNAITNESGINTKDILSTGTITSNVTNVSEVNAVNLNSTGTITSDTITNTNSIVTKDVTSSGTINSNNIISSTITNTNGINTDNLTSSGTINTNSLTSVDSISTKDINSTGVLSASTINNTQSISTKDLVSTGVINSTVINNTNTINAKDLISMGTITTKDIQSETLTTTGSITTGNIVSSGSITTNEMNVNTINSTDLVISGNIITVGESSTDSVTTNFLTLGDKLNSTFSNNVTWVDLNTGMSISPALQQLSTDGEIVSKVLSKVYSDIEHNEVNGTVGVNTVDFEGKFDVNHKSVSFSITAIPSEDYSGQIRILMSNEAYDTSLIDFVIPTMDLTSGTTHEFQFDSPMWNAETETVHYAVLNKDGNPIQVLSNNGSVPYISVKFRNFEEYAVFNESDVSALAETLRNLPLEERIDVLTLQNTDKLLTGTYSGFINFGTDIHQFDNSVRNQYWKADSKSSIGGIDFNIGDKLVCTKSISIVTSLSDVNYFKIERNINSVATTSNAGIMIPNNGLDIDSTGKVNIKLGSGIKFDDNFNISADISNIDVTMLKNFSTLQKGSFRGVMPTLLSDLSGSVRGDFWKASASGTLGIQKFSTGDELYCNVDTVVTPDDLLNFTLVPESTASMIGSTDINDGTGGLVTAPKAGENNKALFGDSTYKSVITPLDVIDNLSSTNTLSPLSANQGSVMSQLISTKASTSDIVDNLLDTSPNKPLSANQGKVLSAAISEKSSTSDIVDNLNSTKGNVPLSANQGNVLNTNIELKLNKTDVIDSLNNISVVKALSANQGYVISTILDQKVGTSSVVDNLNSTSGSSVLSANQGYILGNLISTKLSTSDIVDNLNDLSTNKALSSHQGNVLSTAINTKVDISSVVDNLLSSSPSSPLSANQGKALQSQVNAKVNIIDIIDTLTSTSIVHPLSANQGKILNDALASKVGTETVVDNLTSISISFPLSANQGRILSNQIQTKLNLSDVMDTLNDTSTSKALSSNQGKMLNDKVSLKINTTDIVDNLLSTSLIFPLSARQGNILSTLISTKVSTTDIIDNLTTTNSSKPLSANQGFLINGILANKVNTSDVVDNLTNTSISRPLSANQGYILSTQILTKQDSLVSGTTIKTINGINLLGTGNITTNSDATSTTAGIIKLSGDLSGTSDAPLVSKVNGISITGSPVAGYVLMANGVSTALWQPQTALYNASSTTAGLMSASDKSKFDTISTVFTGSTSSTTGTLGLVPAPTTSDSYNHMLKANGTWGGVNNAGRVSCYNLVSKASTLAWASMTADSAMAVTGNMSLYIGTTTGVTVTQAGMYKVTITAVATSGLLNGGHKFGVGVGTGTTIQGSTYLIDALSVNTISTTSFAEIVTLTAGQNVGCSYYTSSILNKYNGFTMIIEKLD